MTGRSRLLVVLLIGVAAVQLALLLWPTIQGRFLAQESTAAERGYRVAERNGCFTCHGPLGKAGIPNPGSPEGQVPAWSGGNYMMYLQSPEEAREWILYGKPKRQLGDPYYEERASKALLPMPAYEGLLTEAELDDLVAFFEAVAWAVAPPGDARAGRSIARRHGCFDCHGEEGRARQPNPGSLKGYIPSWEGDDFAELVRDDEELRLWITDGAIPRLTENPAARAFIERQRIPMPAYGAVLTEDEVSHLVAYIRWLRDPQPEEPAASPD